MSSGAWELIFMMLILKIPLIYLGFVVWYAIRAEPEPGVEHGVYSVWRPCRRPTGARVRCVDGRNSGCSRALLGEYLENPEAVPAEWRALFESGDSELVATHPGIARLLERLPESGNGHVAPTVTAEPEASPAAEPDARL